jgi:hypothetical protein
MTGERALRLAGVIVLIALAAVAGSWVLVRDPAHRGPSPSSSAARSITTTPIRS